VEELASLNEVLKLAWRFAASKIAWRFAVSEGDERTYSATAQARCYRWPGRLWHFEVDPWTKLGAMSSARNSPLDSAQFAHLKVAASLEEPSRETNASFSTMLPYCYGIVAQMVPVL
jgi:hypothetical protein